MAIPLDYCITDDPAIRRAQIIEVVLSHCASVLWSGRPERLGMAQSWARSLQDATRKSPGTGGLAAVTARSPPKKASSGLSVASADVILCRETPRSRSEPRPSPAAADMVPAAGMASVLPNTAPREGPTGGESVKVADCSTDGGEGVRPNEPDADGAAAAVTGGSASRRVEEGGMAALRPDGDVVFVSTTGSPREDLSHPLGFPSVPVQVRRLSGGITNELFHVFDAEDPSASVVVRVYGKETERVISRESELFYQSLFLRTFAYGKNFLIYEFMEHYETLPYTDMAREATPIARAIAAFQVRATLAAVRDRAEPLMAGERSPRHGVGVDGSKPPTRFERETNYTVHSLTVWVDQITSEDLLAKVNAEKRADFLAVARQLRAESGEMLAILAREAVHLGEGVCHNDLLSANIMRHCQTGALKFIDFDYTKRDFLLFDAANHFNEYTGLECDYARYFPSDEHMTSFLASYREAMRQELATAHAARGAEGAVDVEEIFPNEWTLFWGDGVAVCDRGVYELAVDPVAEAAVVARWTLLVKFLTLCSHLSWSIWSLFQEAVSQLDVDFLEYAKLRLNRYYETKQEFLAGL